MSEKMQKYGWLRNWRAARDNERRFSAEKNTDSAIYWAEIALKIEAGFLAFFGQNFGEYLAEVL